MIPKSGGGTVAVSNRQRRLKIDTKLLAQIARRTWELVGDTDGELSIVLVDDAMIANLNAQYHATPAPTDILSFDYGEGQGELIISVEHAVAQAKRFHTTPARELVLYVAHGILHLHGHDDLALRDRRRMHATQRRLMACLAKKFEFRGVFIRRSTNR
jgi:probable rRNA maturation factor